MKKIHRALISVSDKSGLENLLQVLAEYSIEIISTGGTLKKIKELGYPAKAVEEITGFPEMMNGRVKTLHPKIHGGLLALRDNLDHVKAMEAHGILPIDLVVVNLYPFEQVTEKPAVSTELAIENIDIGGPSMIRSAAKNYRDVCVLVSPNQYEKFIAEFRQNDGKISKETRFQFAMEAFTRTAAYDLAISRFFESKTQEDPSIKILTLEKKQNLRYGENPHQKAAFYVEMSKKIPWKQLHGKELSFNNLLDLDAAIEMGITLQKDFCALLKHTNPCGVAAGKGQLENLRKAMQSDPVSFFGGIAVFSEAVQKEAAEEISKHFMEIIVAPAFTSEALSIFQQKKNLRLIEVDFAQVAEKFTKNLRYAAGGYLLQDTDRTFASEKDLEKKTNATLTKEDIEELLFADKVCKTVKSNAIVFTKEKQTLGIGAGQMSRVDAMRFAIEKAKLAGLSLQGSYLASDAFFPFRDAVDLAAQVGVKAIIQPGGSIRDQEVIEAAQEANIAMVFSGIRHFRH